MLQGQLFCDKIRMNDCIWSLFNKNDKIYLNLMQFRRKITKMLSERKTQLISMQPKTEVPFPQPEPALYTPASSNCGSHRFKDRDPAPRTPESAGSRNPSTRNYVKLLPQKFDVGHFDFTDKDQRTTILKQKMQHFLK